MIMEQQPQRVQIGERLFLLSLFAVIATEAVTTIITASKWFEWTSLLLGLMCFLGCLYLATRIYDGDGKGLQLLRLLACGMIGLLALGLVLLLSGTEKPARMLGVNVEWLTCIKMAAYGGLAAVLFSPGNFADFLASRRGETIERGPATGPALDIPAEQTQTWNTAIGFMRAGGCLLIIAGAMEVLLGLENPRAIPIKSLLELVNGGATMCLGAVLITTAASLRTLLNLADRNTGHLAKTLDSLGTFVKAQIVLGLVMGVVLVTRLAHVFF